MKSFAAFFFLAAFSFLVEAKPEGLRPLNIVLPADPHDQTQEWRPNMAAQVPNTELEPDGRITSGQPARRGQFPWQVAFYRSGYSFCGGSLISATWILTSAICAQNVGFLSPLLGTINTKEPDNGHVLGKLYKIIEHDGYNSSTLDNDIALIQLAVPVEFSLYIRPVRLPSRSQANTDFVNATVQSSGWGSVSDTNSNPSEVLQYANMSVITNSVCSGTFGSVITDTKICVSTADKKSPCKGDGGGPLVFREDDDLYTLVGISSFIPSDGCERGKPAGFTRVTSYLDWIQENTGIEITETTEIASNSWKPQSLSGPVIGLLYVLYRLCF